MNSSTSHSILQEPRPVNVKPSLKVTLTSHRVMTMSSHAKLTPTEFFMTGTGVLISWHEHAQNTHHTKGDTYGQDDSNLIQGGHSNRCSIDIQRLPGGPPTENSSKQQGARCPRVAVWHFDPCCILLLSIADAPGRSWVSICPRGGHWASTLLFNLSVLQHHRPKVNT